MKNLAIICNGHGYNTPFKKSAMPNGIMFEEWEFTRMIKLRLFSIMHRENYPFYDLVPESWDVTLNERVRRANRVTKEYSELSPFLIDIHGDAFTNKDANGITVYTSKGQTKSDLYGDIFVKHLSRMGWYNRYDIDEDGLKGREANFMILRDTICPAVLLELGFYTNEEQVIQMHDDMIQEKIAQLIFEAIKEINAKY